jgi:lysine-specific demethylase/histidyl-hydroxylase NO66
VTAQQSPPALARLIALSTEDFGQKHWDRSPLLTRGADLPGGFTDLLSSAVIDSLVGERGLRQPFFRMVDNAAPVTGLTRSAVAGNRTITDLADPDAVARAYTEGATLVLQSLNRTWPPVVSLCRDLAAELGHPTQCNAYITPAGDAQGFAYHHDTHDVLVLQVEGSKHWEVHEPVVVLPARDQARSGAGLVPEGQRPLLDVVLEAGDTLYLPRGFVHAARTTDEPSIHLTIGVIPTTWLDLLKDMVTQLGADELALRRALPVAGLEPPDMDAEANQLLATATDWLATLKAAQVGEVLRRRAAKTRPREPIGMIAQASAAGALAPETAVRARHGLESQIVVDGSRVSVLVADKKISFPGVAEPMLRILLSGPVTSPAEIVADDPDCDTGDAVVVVRRLVREGVVVAARSCP